MSAAVTGNPQLLMAVVAETAVCSMIPPGGWFGQYSPGRGTEAAIVAMIATADSAIMAPDPTIRGSVSRAMSLGVVPLEIREWNPLMAPQAMVMNAKGNIFPAKMGPVPSTKRVKAGMWSVG